ncbi:LytTR family DNA-binding domain-containing protein [Sanguibacter sp. HDW7]|uniref:LytR/AlgR family response regulator transcription factor n=1 Tax=Sanguibacter sp. HDW7 TaxID=2714931 RepID=UPI00197EF769|nr:LytTR family DNA-binding domain-containing protein [Sanguibacter sp. HDW7]
MIRIGIVEDDDASASLLAGHLRRYEDEHDESFAVTRFVDGAAVVEGYRPDFDILLLDIEMPRLDGFSAAEQIRAADPDVVIIFITNMTQYALKGYEVDALSYVVKPVPYFAFAQEIKRSIARLRRRSVDYLMLQIDGGIVRVPTTDIVFLESAKHRTLVHTVDGIHSVVAPLKSLEAQLDPRHFFRSNSGYVVNLRHVLGVSGNSSLHVGGHDLLVSRARKKDFLAALTDYLGERHP